MSDDTQMTLFTANGILVNETNCVLNGAPDRLKTIISEAYMEWYRTQTNSFPHHYKWRSCWLMNVPELFSERGPGRTCMSALDSGEYGSIKYPINNSSGNGGLMRVAPYGCFFRNMSEHDLILAAAESTAITHGNSLGYMPSGMMALMIRKCIWREETSISDVIESSFRATEKVFSYDPQWPKLAKLIDLAFTLSGNSVSDITNIRKIGRGTTGDTGLAIAVYCSLRYEHDFSAGIIAAVNHDGDSDSTGAITGNLLGAYLGMNAIGEKWIDHLELKDIILEIAEDLYLGVPTKDEIERMVLWKTKYVEMQKC